MAITIVSPSVDTEPGAAGGFSADFAVAQNTPIIIDITDTSYECVLVRQFDEDEDVAYRDGSFAAGFTLNSSETPIANGKRLSVLPDAGWRGSDDDVDVTISIDYENSATWTVDATSNRPIPQNGNEMNALLTSLGISSGGPSHGYLFGASAIRPWMLRKTGGLNGAFDAGIASTTTIAGDGYVQCQTTSESLRGKVIGLSDADVNVNYNSIDFGLYFSEGVGNPLYMSEGGALTLLGSYAEGDVFQIMRTGTAITYWQNGVLLATSGTASAGALLIDTSFYNASATIQGVRLFDAGVEVAITWAAGTNCAAWECAEDIIAHKDLAAMSAPTSWQHVVAGWTSKFLQSTVGVSTLLQNDTFPDVSANPFLLLFRAKIVAPGGQQRSVASIGALFDDDACAEVTVTPRVALGEGFGAARKSGAFDPLAGGVMTWALLIDPVTWKGCVLYTSQERISAPRGGTFANGTQVRIGGDFNATWYPPSMDVLDAWIFKDAAARKPKNEVRAIVEALDGVIPPVYGWNIVKSGGVSGNWDAGAYSNENFAGDLRAQFVYGDGAPSVALGIGADATIDDGYASMDFAIVIDGGGATAYASENGVLTNIGAPAAGDVFEIERVIATGAVTFKKNGALMATAVATTLASLKVDSSIRFADETLHDVKAIVGGVEQVLTWTATNVITY